MPLNLELKVKLNSFEETEQLLKQISAEPKAELNQKDVYYNVPDGLLKLRIENGNQSLIKYNRNEGSGDRYSDYDVLYFSSGEGEEFLASLFEVEAVVEKKRILYVYDNTRVHLDSVNDLGAFLELETLVINGKEDAVKRFDKIVGLLKLDTGAQIKKSYRDLIIEKESNK